MRLAETGMKAPCASCTHVSCNSPGGWGLHEHSAIWSHFGQLVPTQPFGFLSAPDGTSSTGILQDTFAPHHICSRFLNVCPRR